MSGDMMPKEQQNYIEKIQKHCLEETNMTENEAYDFAFRCWQLDYDRIPKKKEFLNFIGRGSCFNVKEGSNSAFFVDGGDLVLIDCGETTFSDLMKINERVELFKDITNIHVLITHYHSDHVGSLPSLIYYAVHILRINIKIYTADIQRLDNILDNGMMYLEDPTENSDIRYSVDYYPLSINQLSYILLKNITLSVVPIEEYHVEKSVGYLIEYFDKKSNKRCKIYYSGDTRNVNPVVYRHDCDYYYMDAANRGEKYPHQDISHIKTICKTFGVSKDKIRLMHIDDDSVLRKAEEYGFTCVERFMKGL